MNALSKTVQKAVADYSAINVAETSQKTQTQKQDAYSSRLTDLLDKFKSEGEQTALKLQQHIDVGNKNKGPM